MVNVNDLKNGMTIGFDGNIYTVIEFLTADPIYDPMGFYEREYDSWNITLSDKVMDKIYDVADAISDQDVDLENKIILAIAIRHKAEVFMLEEIDNYSGTITWKVRHNIVSGTNNDFKLFLEQCSNQTRELYNAYSQFGNYEKVKMLDEVNIMTPENIHLNSFMYEPILDMDINELLNLYQRVKSL